MIVPADSDSADKLLPSFLFESGDSYDDKSLLQGDILQRTNDLKKAIRPAHPYYADEADDYDFFMVLTQSCDLVRRNGKAPKARYITIAAIRPLQVLLDRVLTRWAVPVEGFPALVCLKQNELQVQQLLERLMHNTADGFFFIKNGWHPLLKRDYCCFLSLSIALRANHYDACLGAKIAQLKDVFQAKVGWLTGNLYSRVGTPDIDSVEPDPKSYMEAFFREVLYEQTVWLTTEQRKQLVDLIKKRKPSNPTDARNLLAEIKDDIQSIAERIADRLIQEVTKDSSQREAIVNVISSDRVVGRIIRSLSAT